MLNDLLEEAWKELKDATTLKGHPFRFCSLATAGNIENIMQRTVILREITESKTLIFYTDKRSGKVNQIKINPFGSVLFYNPKKSLQLIIKGEIEIIVRGENWGDHKSKIEGKSTNDYNSKLSPGEAVKNPFILNRSDELNFSLLEFKPLSIEYLKLKNNTNHLRAVFNLNEDNWEETFLVP